MATTLKFLPGSTIRWRATRFIVRKVVNPIDRLSHSKSITDRRTPFADSVLPFAFNLRLPPHIRKKFPILQRARAEADYQTHRAVKLAPNEIKKLPEEVDLD